MTQLEAIMKNLDLTEEEARALLADDAKIDAGQRMDFDLSKEQEKESKKARSTTSGKRKPTVYNLEKKPRKEDTVKRDFVKYIFECAKDYADAENVEITNPERVIAFTMGEDFYELVLQRKNKNIMNKKAGKS